MKFKQDQTSQKLRGGYYTPIDLADYIVKWVLSNDPSNILEPSCGDGVFFEALDNNNCNKNIRILGCELFEDEAAKSVETLEYLEFKNFKIKEGDFLGWAKTKINKKSLFCEKNIQCDAVIGNPPFIRYQFLEDEFQQNTEDIFKLLDLKFTKHTNAWVPFILSSVALLSPGGRIGMVIPSEIIHVMHAQPLRTFLGENCRKVVIVDPKEIWFQDTLQGACILFAEKKLDSQIKTEGVAIQYVYGRKFLDQHPEELFEQANAINGNTVVGKWTKALLSPTELDVIKRLIERHDVYNFKEIADVDVGIVTGANKFFLVNNTTVEQHKLQEYVSPMFGRSAHCKGVIYDLGQHQENEQNDFPSNFVYIEENFESLPKNVQEYILNGEEEELHKRYKCRIRKPWYKVPSVYSQRIGMLKRAHDTPRLIYNELEAYTTDTAYRIRSFGFEAELLVYCFLNPLTALLAEIEGRHYGGGVLELVPSEIEKLYVPIPNNLNFEIKKLDTLVRNNSMTEVLENQGQSVLGGLGVPEDDQLILMNAWKRLKDRRQRK